MNLEHLPNTMTPDPLVSPDTVRKYFRLHHKASVRGYLSRKELDGVVFRYDGRYGKGFAILMPRFDSCGHCWCYYYIGLKEEYGRESSDVETR